MATIPSAPLLIVLFPEDACSIADRNWGDDHGRKIRQQLGDGIHAWRSSVWVISGPNRDELHDSGMLGVYVAGALRRPFSRHAAEFQNALETKVDDVEQAIYGLKDSLRKFRLAKGSTIFLSGTGYSKIENAPMNRLISALEQFGFRVRIQMVVTDPYMDDRDDHDPVYE